MTDVGRDSGSEPWHPGDPLYGDPEWAAQGAQTGGYDRYGDPYQQPQAAAPPPEPYAQGHPPSAQSAWTAADPQAGYGATGPGEPYGRSEQAPYGGADPYGRPDPYGQPDQYGRQAPRAAQDQYGRPYPASQDPYGQPDGYSGGPDPYQRQSHGYATPDPASTPPHGHPREPHRDPHHDGSGAGRRGRPHESGPDEGGRDPHPFFADDPDDFDGRGSRRAPADDREDDEEHTRAGRRRQRSRGKTAGGGQKGKKGSTRRSGCACLVVLLVLGGGVTTVGWYGYNLYQSRFAAAPDYSGGGTGSVQIEIPEGAISGDIAKVLFEAGVVKSAQAFVEAAHADDQAARSIQPGVYTMKKQMSAASALKLLTDTKNLNTLIIAEGLRATKVYEAIDTKLGLKKGTTKAQAKDADLGLPAMAKGNPEGFLYPSRYSVGENTKPVDLLRQMVKQAEAEYARDDLEQAAKGVDRSPYEVIVIASIIQAEAQAKKDFGKVSRVIYNRLDTDATLGRLDMDSTINYALNRSTLDTSTADTKLDHPYNTYVKRGLPPGPIGNPGHQAIEAALNPTEGDWIYFVTVKPGDTRFAVDKAEHDRNVAEFNRYQREGNGG